jgi:hypothetical protein
MKSWAAAKLKRARALELVAEGDSYDEVARLVGFRHRGSAHHAVFAALEEREVDGVEHLRAVELARLDQLQAAWWADAMTGDVKAVSAVLRIIDLRIRVLGLGRPTPSAPGSPPTALVIGPPEDNRGSTTDDP